MSRRAALFGDDWLAEFRLGSGGRTRPHLGGRIAQVPQRWLRGWRGPGVLVLPPRGDCPASPWVCAQAAQLAP